VIFQKHTVDDREPIKSHDLEDTWSHSTFTFIFIKECRWV